MASAVFEGIFNIKTNQYLDSDVSAEEIETLDADGETLIGVIHDNQDGTELTFQCFGDGPHGIFPARWSADWEQYGYTDSEIVQDLLPRSGDGYEVDPDFFVGCTGKATYPKNSVFA